MMLTKHCWQTTKKIVINDSVDNENDKYNIDNQKYKGSVDNENDKYNVENEN